MILKIKAAMDRLSAAQLMSIMPVTTAYPRNVIMLFDDFEVTAHRNAMIARRSIHVYFDIVSRHKRPSG